MKTRTNRFSFLTIILIVCFASCIENTSSKKQDSSTPEARMKSERAFERTLKKHLDAISAKDLDSLKATLSPEGKMQLILSGTEILSSVDSFINYQEAWFQDTSWTFETRVLNTEIGKNIGFAVTEIIYREPERNGLPYFNRMVISYGLEKLGDNWYIILDHASSIEKSTDKK